MSQLLGQNEKGQIHIYCLPQISETIVTIKTGAKLVEEGLCRRCPGGTARSRWLFHLSSWIIRSYDHIVALWGDHLGSLWFGHIVDQDMINAGMMTIFTDLGFLGQAGRTWEWYWSRRQRNQPQAFKVRSLSWWSGWSWRWQWWWSWKYSNDWPGMIWEGRFCARFKAQQPRSVKYMYV